VLNHKERFASPQAELPEGFRIFQIGRIQEDPFEKIPVKISDQASTYLEV
jgi:hypothetical protein